MGDMIMRPRNWRNRRVAYNEGKGLVDIGVLANLRSRPNWFFDKLLPSNSPVAMLAGREVNLSRRSRFTSSDRAHILSKYLPNTSSEIDTMSNTRPYVSQFSPDGTLLEAGFESGDIKMYDVTTPWNVKKNIHANISLEDRMTDASLSPDQRLLAYSGMSSVVYTVNVDNELVEDITEHEELVFPGGEIFSIKFSPDRQEVAATSDDHSIYFYDLAAKQRKNRIRGRMFDVNTVCFADETGNIIYSGVRTVFVRRSLGRRGNKYAGVLSGHLQGITFIDGHENGRYFISNGKDQAIKLWDTRMMSTTIKTVTDHAINWDYRAESYPRKLRNRRHPNDLSLTTYEGHSVLQTLVRCYFSPLYSTGQKYIYTGSADGHVYIYDVVTGEVAARLNHGDNIVRDCSWHPSDCMLGSCSWDGVVSSWEFSQRD